MAEIRSFRELNVYKNTRETASAIFEITKTFPREERYSLTDQIRRSSRAVNAMIAEAWAKRRYEALSSAKSTMRWAKRQRRNHGSITRSIRDTSPLRNSKN
jgi:23S rRNA-intervening sequence protein